jgi:hypothetical protein
MPKYKLLLRTVEVRSCIVEFPGEAELEDHLEHYDVPDDVFHTQVSFRTELDWHKLQEGDFSVTVLPYQEQE